MHFSKNVSICGKARKNFKNARFFLFHFGTFWFCGAMLWRHFEKLKFREHNANISARFFWPRFQLLGLCSGTILIFVILWAYKSHFRSFFLTPFFDPLPYAVVVKKDKKWRMILLCKKSNCWKVIFFRKNIKTSSKKRYFVDWKTKNAILRDWKIEIFFLFFFQNFF